MDGQRKARKREPADMHTEKGEKINVLNYQLCLYHFSPVLNLETVSDSP